MNDKRSDLLKALHCFTIEKYVSIIIMLVVILLIGLNILRVYKEYILVHHSETKSFYDLKNILYNSETMTLSIDGSDEYPMLEVIVNGNLIDKFGKNKQIIVNVNDGDVVQINGSMYSDIIMVSMKNISSNTTNYLNNKQVLVKQNISTLAVIKM